MPKILNVIQILTLGGAARALCATAKNSRLQGGFEHSVLSLLPPEAKAVAMAQEAGLRVIAAPSKEVMDAELQAADIVQLHWWNVTENTDFLNGPLPPIRLMIYYHVCGDQLPHIITPRILGTADFNVACNPYTFLDNPAFRDMDPVKKATSCGMVYGAADFSRLEGIRPKAHNGFNIGYIGTIDFIKMHPDYVKMSAAIRIPDSKFVICGDGSLDILRQQAQASGAANRFDIRGYVDDVRSAIAEFDIYGYPLCEETYAGSELNLQEVMYAGVVPVVFPYGGVKRLVVNDFTGLIVNSALEYKEAVEFLYNHPAERRRLGANARSYAEQIFGAENAATKINILYSKMLARPKRTRARFMADLKREEGSSVFIATLGEAGKGFRNSREAATLEEAWRGDEEIERGTRLLFISGVGAYRGRYPTDPFLRYWAGLFFAKQGNHSEAALEFLEAIKHGFPDWRVQWRTYQAAKKIDHAELMKNSLAMLERIKPDYQAFIDRLASGAPIPQAQKSTSSPVAPHSGSNTAMREAMQASALSQDKTFPATPETDSVAKAESLLRAGKPEQAQKVLEDALKNVPGNAKIMNDIGVIQHTRGEKNQARRMFMEAVKANPEYVEAILNLGDSLMESGLNQEALGLYYQFLDSKPEDESLLAAAKQMEEIIADDYIRGAQVRDLNYKRKNYLVSALVSTYNSADFIRECLEDLEGQTMAKDLEIIIVDASSPGDESRIVEEFQRKYDNIRYIRTKERIGIYPAWNVAVRASSGTFMTPMSTNDRLAPDAYARQLQVLNENPKVALVYGDTYLTNIPHQVFGKHTPTPEYGGVFQWPPYSYEDLLVNCRVGPHPIWRKSVHAEIGYFDGRYKAIGDQDFWLRIALKWPLVHIPVFTGLAWITKESLSGQGSSMNEILTIHNKHTAAYLKRIRPKG